jgi:hypothetical protein
VDKTVKTFKVGDKSKYDIFKNSYKGYKVYDLYDDLYIQYEFLKNPNQYFSSKSKKDLFVKKIRRKLKNNPNYSYGSWIILPERKEIMHLLKKKEYLDFRTFRNRNIITHDEQVKVYNKKILFIGMSVGSQVLLSFVRTGIGNQILAADADKVELHNLNRTSFLIEHLNRKKVHVMGDQVFSIDPYVNYEAIDMFVDESNLNKLMFGVDLIVDCFDNFAVKIMLRKKAKKMKIPVLSGFDISKGAMVISERYDTEKNLNLDFFLNGHTEKELELTKDFDIRQKTELFIKIVGRKYHDKRMLSSVRAVGKTLTGYPQLSIATTLASSLWTAAALDILLGKVRKSVRVYLNLEKAIYENKIN